MEKYTIKCVGKARKIRYDGDGNAYFNYGDFKIFLEDCPRINGAWSGCPSEHYDKNGKKIDIVGYYAFGLAGILLEFLDNGDRIRVWDYI